MATNERNQALLRGSRRGTWGDSGLCTTLITCVLGTVFLLGLPVEGLESHSPGEYGERTGVAHDL